MSELFSEVVAKIWNDASAHQHDGPITTLEHFGAHVLEAAGLLQQLPAQT